MCRGWPMSGRWSNCCAQFGVSVDIARGSALGEGDVFRLHAAKIDSALAPYDIVRKMRASFQVLGPFAGASRPRQDFTARRLRHWRAAGRFAHQGLPGDGRQGRSGRRLCHCQRAWRADGRDHRISLCVGGRDGKSDDRCGAGQGPHGAEKCRARTRDAKSRGHA